MCVVVCELLFRIRLASQFYHRGIYVLCTRQLITNATFLMGLRCRRLIVQRYRLKRRRSITCHNLTIRHYRAIMDPCQLCRILLRNHTLNRLLVGRLRASVIGIRQSIQNITRKDVRMRRIVISVGPFRRNLCTMLLTTSVPSIPFILLMRHMRSTIRRRQYLPTRLLRLRRRTIANGATFKVIPRPIFRLSKRLNQFILVSRVRKVRTTINDSSKRIHLTFGTFRHHLSTCRVLHPHNLIHCSIRQTRVRVFRFKERGSVCNFLRDRLGPVQYSGLINKRGLYFRQFLHLCQRCNRGRCW